MFDEEVGYDEAGVSTRSVELAVSSKGVTYRLEPKYGHIRGIVCYRTDGQRTTCPDRLEGGFTDQRAAEAAVRSYLEHRGGKQPVPNVAYADNFDGSKPVELSAEEQEARAEAARLELARIADELAKEPPLEGVETSEGETVTQAARRSRVAK